jgi:hypothetical protein
MGLVSTGVTLACAWNPRGELPRLIRLTPQIRALYVDLAVSVPHDDLTPELARELESLGARVAPFVGWSGRHTVIRLALDMPGAHLHYVDLDRLLRWLETRPHDLAACVDRIGESDCLIIGRTQAAYDTHPRSMIETEQTANLVFSHWFGQPADTCAGSKGFSRAAAQFILAHSPNDNSLRMDAEWPILLRRAGFALDYTEADGLDWETADRYLPRAADHEAQKLLASRVDQDPDHWRLRVRVARDIVQFGLAAMTAALEASS